jgi:stage III sporulation protein AD
MSILVVLIAIKLKKINGEYSTLISIGACLLIIGFIITRLTKIMSYMDKISSYVNIDMEYISIIFKMLGISFICEFSSGICKDAGFSAIATHIEIAGRVSMIVISLPILFSVIDMVAEMVGT